MTKEIERDLFLTGVIDEGTIKPIVEAIYRINKHDDEQEKTTVDYKRDPIKLIVDTYGGDIYTGMGLVNIIQTSKTEVHGYCYSKAMSMGIPIFGSCHKRFAHERSQFMVHQLRGGTIDVLQQMEENIEQYKVLQERMDKIVMEVTKIPESKLRENRKNKQDWFFTGDEAMDLGLVDEFIK